jgi:hypothetical protein
MSQSLVPCLACNRHVLADASVCPFCTARREARESPRAERTAAMRHLGRAAMLAAGAAMLGAEACGSSVPAYGIPPDDVRHDAGSTGGKGGGGQGGTPGAATALDGGSSD